MRPLAVARPAAQLQRVLRTTAVGGTVSPAATTRNTPRPTPRRPPPRQRATARPPPGWVGLGAGLGGLILGSLALFRTRGRKG